MGKTERRVTGFFLATIVFLLGIGSAVLLYISGQNAIDAFWGSNALYKDEKGWIHHRDVEDDWYGRLVLRAWALGFMYVIPGVTGIIASITFSKTMMIQHFVFAILALTLGSVLHTTGGAALILYRVLMIQGVQRYDPWLGDCIYVNDNPLIRETYEDEQCLKGRKALLFAIGALGTLFLGWVFVLSHMLYCAFTFSTVLNSQKKKGFLSVNKEVNRSAYTQLEDDPLPRRCTCGAPPQRSSRPYRRGKRIAPPIPPQNNTSNNQTTPQPGSSGIINQLNDLPPQPSTSSVDRNDQTSSSIYPKQELHATNTTYGLEDQPTNVFRTFPPSTQSTTPVTSSAQFTSAREENTNTAEVYHPSSFYPTQDQHDQYESGSIHDNGTTPRTYDESVEVTARDIDVSIQGAYDTDSVPVVEQKDRAQSEEDGFVNEGFVQA